MSMVMEMEKGDLIRDVVRHNVLTFGALGDGAADDTAAIQAAIDAAAANPTGGWVFFPSGDYRITAALKVSAGQNVSLVGTGPGSRITQMNERAHAILFSAKGSGFQVRDLSIFGQGAGQREGAAICWADGSALNAWHGLVENVFVVDYFDGFDFRSADAGQRQRVRHCNMLGIRGVGIRTNQSLIVEHCVMFNADGFSHGILCTGGTMYLDNVDIIGAEIGVDLAPTRQSVEFCFFRQLLCDSSRDVGLRIAPTERGSVMSTHIDDSWFATTVGGRGCGVLIAGTEANVVETRISNSRLVNNEKQGLRVTGGRGVTLHGCDVDGNGGADAISLEGGRDFAIANCRIGQCHFGGVPTNGLTVTAGVTSGVLRIVDNDFAGQRREPVHDLAGAGCTRIISDNAPTSVNAGRILERAVAAAGVSIDTTTAKTLLSTSVTPKATEKILVTGVFDVQNTRANGADCFVGKLRATPPAADPAQASQAIFLGNGVGGRATVSQTWVLTLEKGKTYSLALTGQLSAGNKARYEVFPQHTSLTAFSLG